MRIKCHLRRVQTVGNRSTLTLTPRQPNGSNDPIPANDITIVLNADDAEMENLVEGCEVSIDITKYQPTGAFPA